MFKESRYTYIQRECVELVITERKSPVNTFALYPQGMLPLVQILSIPINPALNRPIRPTSQHVDTKL